jgi:hypothetical protein
MLACLSPCRFRARHPLRDGAGPRAPLRPRGGNQVAIAGITYAPATSVYAATKIPSLGEGKGSTAGITYAPAVGVSAAAKAARRESARVRSK